MEALTLKLDWCGADAAKFACENWHYSRRAPLTGRVAKIGVWERGKFVGALIFGSGASPSLASSFGLEFNEVVELTRVALYSKHETQTSRVVSIALRMIRKAFPKLRLVVSFADPEHGHHGGIYQAGGWIYLGQTDASPQFSDARTGAPLHSRTVGERGGAWTREAVTRGLIKRVTRWKHRYVFPFDAELLALARSLAVPNVRKGESRVRRPPTDMSPFIMRPKHLGCVVGTTDGEGGSIPTRTL